MICRSIYFVRRFVLLTGCLIFFFFYVQGRGSIKVRQVQCEYLTNPLGLDEVKPRFGWTLDATDSNAHGQRQTAYRLLIASSRKLLDKNVGDIWNPGWVSSAEMQHIEYEGKLLQSDRMYYWKVCVKDEQGTASAWSTPSYWSTGLLQSSDWKAQWIGSDVLFRPAAADCNIADPWFRKTFDLRVKPGKAMLFVASVGFHEVYVNGRRIGKELLAPAVTDYAKRARYVTYDIAGALKPGRNVIAFWLGSSWSVFGPYRSANRPNTPIVLAQVSVYREKDPVSGSRPIDIITTDSSWKEHPSASRLLGVWHYNQMGGELWDAGKENINWNTLSCIETDWKAAVVYHPKLVLSAQKVEGNRLFEEIHPLQITARKDGAYRVDMGVNFAGWTAIKVSGSPGDTIRFQYSEREQEEMTFGLHSMYIVGKSGEGTFRNRFNYSSCRWITIKGVKKKPVLSDIQGWLVRTAYEPAAVFECSDTLQNWIYDRVRWTFENLSLGGYVVDCPQRERLGYGGDAHATCETGLFNFQMGAFYNKWMEDWRDVKGTEIVVGNMYDTSFAHKGVMGGRYLDPGVLPNTAPTYEGGGGPAWGGIVVTLPWTFYQHYGDKRILEENFELIRDWLSFLDTHTRNNLLQRYGGSWDFLGDWLWPNATAEGMNNNKPQTMCLNNCYRVYNLRTAAKIARVLGKTTDAEQWEHQAEVYSDAINARFYNSADHSYADSSMANLAAALLAGVPPAALRKEVMQRLEKDILVIHKGHIHVGITAGALLFKLLREEGRDDLIYAMTSQTGYPGWGYMKAQGATTIWEAWEKDLPGKSLLHSSYLYPGAWYIDGVAGLRRDPVQPGFRSFIIRPPLLSSSQISWARATFESPAGYIKTAWKKEGGTLIQEITVPPNCTASVQLPQNATELSGFDNPFVKQAGVSDGYHTYSLQAGKYVLKTGNAY